MKIPAEMLNLWKSMRSHGDNDKIIANATDSEKVLITRAFNRGSCTDELFLKLKAFYLQKEKKLFPERFNTTGHE